MYPVVYSYKKTHTRELELSIESLKNIDCWNGAIYIVGDDPKLDIDYTYLPIAHDWGKKSHNRFNDEICAYLTGAELIGDFIMMADDFFILKPWVLERHNRGSLSSHIASRAYRDRYARQLERTQDFLTSHNKDTLSYELHIPMLIKSQQLLEVINIIPHNANGVFIRSVIGNWFDEPSTYLEDTKRKPLTEETVIHSSQDNTFNYEKVRGYLCV